MKKSKEKNKHAPIRIKDNFSDGPDLKLNHAKDIAGKVFLGIIILLVAVFLIKTKVWEISYYSEKEGSTRNPVISVDPNANTETISVDETEVTEEQRTAHYVAQDQPRYLTIEKLGIYNARILSVGVTSSGAIDVPYNIFDVGWYNRSDKPGTGGVMVLDGHNGGPNVHGVFKELNKLYSDDLIVIERGDGAKFTYKVVENKEVPLADSDQYMAVAFSSPVHGTESITIISCIGEWSQTQQTYLSRQFVRAILVE